MAQQKWNLGDIRPASPRARGLPNKEEAVLRQKRPMQDVIASAPHTTAVNATDTSDTFSENQNMNSSEPLKKFRTRGNTSTGGGKKKIVFFGGMTLVLLLVGFLATLFLQGAELTVYPKFKNVTVQATFTAYQDPAVNTLGYELLTLEETGERSVAATRAEEVKERAGGDITLYNAFSKDPQRLIKNTRFESADGKVFRIQDPVVIPGYTTDSPADASRMGGKIPGSITTKVFADATGETYNIPPGRFTIPAFKGDPQFDTMYAESKSPMQGGFIGTKLIVEETELTSTRQAIQTELKEKILARLRNERPAGFELYESAARIRFESLPSVDAGENQATIRERAILEAPLFAEADFARYLAQNTIVGYGNEEVRIENSQSLTFSYVTASSSEPVTNGNKIDFNLAGNAKIVWKYDKNQLRDDVAGTAKKELLPNILLKKYQPAIERATTVMRPFWKQSFPDDPAKIKIIEILDSGGE